MSNTSQAPAPSPQAPALSPEDLARIPSIQRDAENAARLQAAVLGRNADLAFDLCLDLVAGDVDLLDRFANGEELSLRRIMFEILDDALRLLLLADDTETDHWKQILLPDKYDLFAHPMLLSNAVWLRNCGSEVLDNNNEHLDPAILEGLGFKSQALALGRFCMVNDGRTAVDFLAIREALDARNIPLWDNWLLTVYCASPNRVAEQAATKNQDDALAAFLKANETPHKPSPATAAQSSAAYEGAYRVEGSLRALFEEVNGRRIDHMYKQFIPGDEHEPPERPELDVLGETDCLVICPNWHDEHVIHRCMSPLVRGMLRDGAQNLRVYPERMTGQTRSASDWAGKSIDAFHDDEFSLAHMALIARQVRSFDLDFAFYPEIVPSNSTAWMATERMARVQATGYGFPVTSGLKTIDYFIGGADVEPEEREGKDYTERLVLLPGLGVSTTPPPIPECKRERPIDDDQIKLCAIVSKHKLGTELLQSWNAIQEGESGTSFAMFTNMTEQQANFHAPALSKLLTAGEVDLVSKVPRPDLMRIIADSDLCLDAYPFGGFNTLVEMLMCGVPVLTLEGSQSRNRFGPAILRRLELPEFMIAKSYGEYVETAKRLIRDAGLRQSIRDQIGSPEDVLSKLADPYMADHFDAAVRWMREQGPKGQGDLAPVYIEAGEKPRTLSA